MAPIVLKYWPILARGGGLMRMCCEKNLPFEHDTDMKEFGAAWFGAETGNLAPPILIDGDLTISQSSACHVYLGKKLGLTAGIDTLEADCRAMQYMADLHDLHAEVLAPARVDPTALQ